MSTKNSIEEILSGYKGIGLTEVQKASLLRRKDRKYIFSLSKLASILEELKDSYDVLEIGNNRVQNYQTKYFDTPKLDMYHMHHRGMLNRHKIRFRKYNSSELVFLEVKRKDSRGVTTKKRLKIENGNSVILSKEEEFLSSFTPYGNEKINPALENNFNRITLVHRNQKERITLDYHLSFSKPGKSDSLKLFGVAIAEIKFQNRLSGTVFVHVLRKNKIPPRRFSKYCTGMAMLNPDLKQNLFKMKIKEVNKLNNENL
ncbi:MAG: polyphosphate polymerase domain-containing protein [Bacteroidales bacterium]|nr:polyphosphate polymerase domain-containing protein [Bacteroidales bacterium]